MKRDFKNVIVDFVDFLMPELTPYETSLYLLLLRKSFFSNGDSQIRIGKRTMAQGYGTGSRGVKTNYAHMTKTIKGLEEKGCISIGDTNRGGTLYTLRLPRDIPIVQEILATKTPIDVDEDYFTDPTKRKIIFERDKWTCQYCEETVTADNVTLDHFVPQCKGGTGEKTNLRTACLLCNSIKSGKTYEEAAPYLLKSINGRKKKSRN